MFIEIESGYIFLKHTYIITGKLLENVETRLYIIPAIRYFYKGLSGRYGHGVRVQSDIFLLFKFIYYLHISLTRFWKGKGMEIIRKDHIWIKLFSILLAIVTGTACLAWRWGHDSSLAGNIAQAAQAEQLKLVLKTDRVDYQRESLVKAVVQMDTEHAGVQAYSIYLNYDQDLLKPVAIYKEAGQYDQSYYQYEGLAMNPIMNYTPGNVNAQYVSINHTIDRAGSILFIAYFQVIAIGEGSADIWITKESTFTGSASNHTNRTMQIGEDSILRASVSLEDQKEDAENSNPSDIQNTTMPQETENSTEPKPDGTTPQQAENNTQLEPDETEPQEEENSTELTQDKDHSLEDQTSQQENNTNGTIKNEDDKENNPALTVSKKKKPKLNKKKAVIRVGKTLKLKVKNTKKKIIWSSSKKKIASVNTKGKVKAKKPGTVVIRAKVKGGDILKCRVTIKKKRKRAYNPTVKIAEASAAKQIKLVLETEQVKYQGAALIKAMIRMETEKAGIQAYSLYLGYNQKRLKPVEIREKGGGYDKTYYEYTGLKEEPMVNYEDGNVNAQYVSITHSVDQAGSILFIAYFKAVKSKGSTNIQIKKDSNFTGSDRNGKNKVMKLDLDSVIKVRVDLDGIAGDNPDKKQAELNKTKLTMRVGTAQKLKVKDTNKKVKWSSSRRKIVSVNKRGRVKARKPGTAVIRAKIKGGKIFQCKVIVKKK